MAYPYRSPKVRPKKPFKGGRKGGRKPSSEHISGRRKTWLSERETTDGRADTGSRSGHPWWKSPMMKADRLKAAALRRQPETTEDI